MTKKALIIAGCFFSALAVVAQPQTREDLEKQKLQIKNEMAQLERLSKENDKAKQSASVAYKVASLKVSSQERMIETINKDIDILDNNIAGIQKDIRRYDRLLDTLKTEYARSMVYAYKNRNNYEFINFIFSAASFNDAMKRIAYLKSYRSYREMQGENILRTQELRRQRVEALGGVKIKKNAVLEDKSQEMDKLEKTKAEKDKYLAELKKQGKQLAIQYNAKKKQLTKVTNAINLAIKKAQDEAKKAAILAARASVKTTPVNPAPNPKSPKQPAAPKVSETFPLSPENEILNDKFENNRGRLPWPIQTGYILMGYGLSKLESGTDFVNPALSFGTEVGTPVKSVFNGVVSSVVGVDEMQVVIIQHGRYFTTYSNLSGVSVSKGQNVGAGQVIGRAAANDQGVGEVDFLLSNEKKNFDPEDWLKRR